LEIELRSLVPKRVCWQLPDFGMSWPDFRAFVLVRCCHRIKFRRAGLS